MYINRKITKSQFYDYLERYGQYITISDETRKKIDTAFEFSSEIIETSYDDSDDLHFGDYVQLPVKEIMYLKYSEEEYGGDGIPPFVFRNDEKTKTSQYLTYFKEKDIVTSDKIFCRKEIEVDFLGDAIYLNNVLRELTMGTLIYDLTKQIETFFSYGYFNIDREIKRDYYLFYQSAAVPSKDYHIINTIEQLQEIKEEIFKAKLKYKTAVKKMLAISKKEIDRQRKNNPKDYLDNLCFDTQNKM